MIEQTPVVGMAARWTPELIEWFNTIEPSKQFVDLVAELTPYTPLPSGVPFRDPRAGRGLTS